MQMSSWIATQAHMHTSVCMHAHTLNGKWEQQGSLTLLFRACDFHSVIYCNHYFEFVKKIKLSKNPSSPLVVLQAA